MRKFLFSTLAITVVISLAFAFFAFSSINRGSSTLAGENSLQMERKEPMAHHIREKDIDYFVSSVVDYLSDSEDFGRAVDDLSREEALGLYDEIEARLEVILRENTDKSFASPEKRDQWIVSRIHSMKEEILRDPQGFLSQ